MTPEESVNEIQTSWYSTPAGMAGQESCEVISILSPGRPSLVDSVKKRGPSAACDTVAGKNASSRATNTEANALFLIRLMITSRTFCEF